MLDLRKIEELVDGVTKFLPAGGGQLQTEVRENVRLALQSAFARMELVTREEFDAQTALLRRTREKVDELERLLEERRD